VAIGHKLHSQANLQKKRQKESIFGSKAPARGEKMKRKPLVLTKSGNWTQNCTARQTCKMKKLFCHFVALPQYVEQNLTKRSKSKI
jgi:hypothetical protein